MALIRTEELEEMVMKYKTISSKKAFLTRQIKELKEYQLEVKNAYDHRQEGKTYGWYLGDRIYQRQVNNAERDIKIVERFKREKFTEV